MEEENKFLHWCKRYLSLTAFLVLGLCVYVVFFNDNSVIRANEYEEEIRALRAEIKDNRDTLEYYRNLNLRLQTDPVTMERIVREQYHMQRPGEDVYVFE